MSFLGSLALVLLTMVGYSSGVTLAVRPRGISPAVVDLWLLLVTWVAVFWLRAQLSLGHLLSFVLGVTIGLLVGFIRTKLRLLNEPATIVMPDSELPEHAREQTTAVMIERNPFKRAWQAWKKFASEMGNVQGRMLMGYFYFIIVTPFALGAKLFSDPLGGKKQPPATDWHGREPESASLESAREQG
jgi:hypothetical protein